MLGTGTVKYIYRKTQLKWASCIIIAHQTEKYLIWFLTDLNDPEYTGALLMVDIFTKYTVLVPVKTKKIPHVALEFAEAINQMVAKPQSKYSDDVCALVDSQIQRYYNDTISGI